MAPTLISLKNHDKPHGPNEILHPLLKQKAALCANCPNDSFPVFGAQPDAKLAINNHNAASTQP